MYFFAYPAAIRSSVVEGQTTLSDGNIPFLFLLFFLSMQAIVMLLLVLYYVLLMIYQSETTYVDRLHRLSSTRQASRLSWLRGNGAKSKRL